MTGRWPEVLRHRQFALLWAGQTVSLAGDGVFSLALALETLRLSPAAGALSLVLAARTVPTLLLLLPAGAVTDRASRRSIMLASDVLRGSVVAAIAVLAAAGNLRVWELVVLSAVFGVGDAFFMPAFTAVVPELLDDHLLVQANALSGSTQLLAQSLAGPAIGGVLVATAGGAWSFAFDAATFAVSALCLSGMQRRPAPAREHRSVLSDVRAGVRYTRRQPWLWWTIVGTAVANFAIFTPTGVLLPLLVRHALHAGPYALGTVMAAGGLGGAAAAFAIGRFGAPRRRVATMWTGWVAAALLFAVLGLVGHVWEAVVLDGLAWFGVSVGSVIWTPLMQQRVPDELLGRVSSVDWLLSLSLSPLGYLAAGAVAGAIGSRTTLVIGGALSALGGLVVLIPGVRDPDRIPAVGGTVVGRAGPDGPSERRLPRRAGSGRGRERATVPPSGCRDLGSRCGGGPGRRR